MSSPPTKKNMLSNSNRSNIAFRSHKYLNLLSIDSKPNFQVRKRIDTDTNNPNHRTRRSPYTYPAPKAMFIVIDVLFTFTN